MISGILKYFRRSFHIVPWWIVFPNQLGLLPNGDRKRQVSLRKGGSFWIRPNTRDINEVLAVGLGHEYPKRLFSEFATLSGTVLIDCGAHIGTFAIYASQLIPQGMIVSFEPERENYGLLKDNVLLNNLQSRIQVIRAAVASSDGTVKLHLSKNNNGHSLAESDDTMHEVQEIPGLSLGTIVNKYCSGRPYALKLDIEGFEYDVLQSAKVEVSGAIFILMEWHLLGKDKEARWQWLTSYFNELGFIGESLSQSPWGGVAIWRRK
jgi:FkbM family methyltransferase